ncbi:MAG: MFS transporter, partial [Planctomycetota bacterium]|nr:MFS transporter [Planctomycetota bacterium]
MSDVPDVKDDQGSSLTQLGKYLIIVTAFLGWFFGGTHMAINGLAMRTAALELLVISGEGELTPEDKTTIDGLSKSLDTDKDGVIQTAHFRKSGSAADDGKNEITKAELAAVGLTKNPDVVSILGKPGDKNGEISSEELQRYVVDARLGGRAGGWFGYYVCAFLFGAALGGLVFGRIGDRYGRSRGMAAAITCYSGMSLIGYFSQSPEQLWLARFVTCMGVGGMWPNGVALMSEAWKGVSRPMLAGVIGTAANVGIFLT